MMYERKQVRKAERQRKEMAQKKRKALEKAAPALLAACKKIEPFLSQLAREYPDLHPREEHIKITQAIAEAKK